MANYKTLEKFIEEVLSDAEKKCTLLSCFYSQPTGGTREVHSISLEGKTWEAKTLYRTLAGVAEHHVQDKPGLHTFEVQAYFDKRTAPEKQTTFTVKDGEIQNAGASRNVAEHPNAVGVTAQLMRHLETQASLNVSLVTGVTQLWSTERQQLIEALRKEREETNEAYAIIREFIMDKTEKEHENQMSRLRFQRDTEIQGTMVKMAPALVNAATGKQTLSTESSDSAILDSLAERVSPEQVEGLVQMGIIDASLKTGFIARIVSVRERKAKEAEELKKLAPGDTGNVVSLMKRSEG